MKLSSCIIRGLTFDIAINDFFTSWFLALPYATQQAELVIQDVTNELDPEKKTNSALSDILTALITGLAFTGPEGAAAGAAATLSVTKVAGQDLRHLLRLRSQRLDRRHRPNQSSLRSIVPEPIRL